MQFQENPCAGGPQTPPLGNESQGPLLGVVIVGQVPKGIPPHDQSVQSVQISDPHRSAGDLDEAVPRRAGLSQHLVQVNPLTSRG